MYALKNNKYRVLLLTILLAAMLFALPAQAEDPISFSISVEPSSLAEPGPVTVSVRVGNNSGADMTEPVSLQDPDGQIVTAFGDGGQALIKQGEFVTAQQTYQVTQEQLNQGKLTYTLSYNQVAADGSVVVQTLLKDAELTYTGTNVDLTVNRTIDPEVVRRDKTVTVQYELYNSGNVEIKNIKVRENSSISGHQQTVAALAPGERKTIQFTATMGGSNLKSAGRVSYSAGDKTGSIDLPEVEIAKANPGLVLTDILKADKDSITDGETVILTLTIPNNGNITYSNITVSDDKYGELFTNLTLGPGETLVREKEFTLSESTAFKYTIVLPDNTGTTNTVTSNEVKVSVYDPQQVLMLSLLAECSETAIPAAPADVDFTLTVTNNSSFEAKNIALSHGSVRIYTVEKLEPGQSVSVTRTFTVSEPGKFRFTASGKDPLDNTVSFDSNEIQLAVVPEAVTPTMAPVPTVAPPVLVTEAPIEVLEPVTLQANRILRYAAMVLVPVFAVLFLLFIASSVARVRRRSKSKNAYDHMDLGGGERAYTEESKYPVTREEPEKTEDAPVSDVEKPSDEILREESSAPVAPAGEDGGYRLTREGSEPVAEEAQAPAEEKEPEDAAPQRRRRSGRSNPQPDEDE